MNGGKIQNSMKKAAVYICIAVAVVIYLQYQFPKLFDVRHRVNFETASVPENEDENKPITLLTFGDMMLDRQVRNFMTNYGEKYPLTRIEYLFSGNDIVFTNLEGTITPFSSKTTDLKNKVLHFTFDPKVAVLLKDYGFNVVSLANNHAYDFLREGSTYTKQYLSDAGISYFGDPYNKEEISVVKDIRGTKIAFVGYHEFYAPSIASVVNEITQLKDEADIIIVAPHWGIEYETIHSTSQKERAHAFIDAGATMVLGAHPHVVQPIELYKGRVIFYSLGNFVFDQDFSFETTHGLGVHISIDEDALQYKLIPIDIIKSHVSVSDEGTRNIILETLSKNSVGDTTFKQDILNGEFVLDR